MLSAFPSEPLWSLLNCPYIFASHPPAACSSGLWPGTSHVTHSPGRVKGTQLKELACVVNPQSCVGTSSSCLHSGRLATTPASFQPAFSASQLLLQCETSAHSLRSSRSASPLMTPKCKFLTIVSDQFLTVALSPPAHSTLALQARSCQFPPHLVQCSHSDLFMPPYCLPPCCLPSLVSYSITRPWLTSPGLQAAFPDDEPRLGTFTKRISVSFTF